MGQTQGLAEYARKTGMVTKLENQSETDPSLGKQRHLGDDWAGDAAG